MIPRFIQIQSLKSRVTLLTLAIFAIGIWSLGFFVSQMLREDMQRLTGEQQFSTVSILADEVNKEISGRLLALKEVAGQLSPILLGDPKALQKFLEEVLTLQAQFNGGITILRADGTAVADVPLSAGRVGVNYMDTVVTATVLRKGKAAISSPMVGKSMNAPIIVMAVPVFDAQNQVIGAISGLTNLGKPNFLDFLTESHYGKTGGFFLISAQNRLVVTATDKRRIMEALPGAGVNVMLDRVAAGYEGTMIGVNPRGAEVLASVKSVPVAGWSVVAQMPTQEAFSPVLNMLLRLRYATVILTVVAGLLTWWMLRRQLTPMATAAKTLATYSGGNQPVQPLQIVRQDEIGQLIGGFNRLLEMLNQRDAALRESEVRHRILVDGSLEAIVVHRHGKVIYINPVAVTLFGAKTELELIGRTVLDFIHPDSRQRVIDRMQYTSTTGVASPVITEKYHKLDGTEMELEVQSRSIVFDGAPAVYVALRDITASRQAQREIETLAFFDTLTGLPNRRLLTDRLKQALSASFRHKREGALLSIDLDNLKDLNDTLGYDKGDAILQQVSHRLTCCVREGDTVARIGGDEFVVLLEDLCETAADAAVQAERVAEEIQVLLAQPYQLSGYEYHGTASIGITLFNDHEQTVEKIMGRADLAMNHAKIAGRNTVLFFDPVMQASVTARSGMESDLRRAISENQFSLHYQAQVTSGHHCIGAEALLRWYQPEKGWVPPSEFISLAEETGMILPIGQWVLETACIQLAKWAADVAMEKLTLAVNVSAYQFRHAKFVDQVLAVIQNTGANPLRLKLELTESLLVSNVEDIIRKMNALKAHGISFSLDDFGTGYSSLSYLKRLPLDQLKIDQGFVRDILIDPNDAAIAKMVIVLGQSLGLAVIAEGVETEAQRASLAELGCNTYQGYLFGRPLPVDEFERMARQA